MFSIFLILKGFFAGLAGVALGIFIFFTAGQLIFKDFYKPFVVLSGSMEPAIMTGSVVIVKPQTSYFIGDVITFSAGKDNLVTHRITNIEAREGDTFYKTKGDANEDPDHNDLARNKIFGKVALSVPYIGYIIDFAKTPQGFILFVIVPATIIVYEELKSIKNEVFKKRKKKSSDEYQVSSIFTHPPPNSGNIKVAAIIPIMGVIFVIAFGITKSFFFDQEGNIGNILGAASDFGNTPTPSPTPTNQPTLVINEVLTDSSCSQGNTEAQWIEVYNGYFSEVNLKNFKITDGTNTIDLVTANSVLVPSGEFALLAHNSAIWSQNGCFDDNDAITANLGGQLNIDTGTLQLLDSQNNVIDTVKWGGANVHHPAQNESIERNPDGLDTAFGTNFFDADFVLRTTPQPGL